jgi:KaiC/GvpD/RAD55 family RecA-like ATPase
MNIPTGVEGLDKILGGGIPPKSTVLLIGPPGCGKTTLCQQFIFSGLKNTEPAFYVTLDSSPDDIRKTMGDFKWDLDPYMKKKKMYFLDAYSWKVGGGKENENVKVISGGLDINSINLTLADILDKINAEGKRGIFDSISTLLLFTPPELVLRFIPILIAKAKNANSTQMLILEEGVHDEKIVNTLSYMADGVINIKMDGDKRFLQISKMKGAPCTREWLNLKITKTGLVVSGKAK